MQSTFTAKLAVIATIPLMLALLTACSGGTENSPSTGKDGGQKSSYADSAEWQLAYAKCMRGEGIDMPDPNGKDDPGVPAARVGDDAVEKANAACISRIGNAPDAPGTEKKSNQDSIAEQIAIARCFREAGFDVPDPSENAMMSIPDNVPADVFEKCIPGISGGSTPNGQ